MRAAPAPKIWRTGTLAYTSGGLALLFCWLLWGDFAWSMRDRSVPPAVQLLFKHFEASDTLIGILCVSLPSTIGLVLGPVVGYRSDRFRSRWGRRIPFLLVPTPFIVLSIVGLGFSPQIGSWVHRLTGAAAPGLDLNLTVLLFMGVFWTVFEIGCTVANAVFGALINDVVPQAVIGRFFGLFRACSLLAGIVLNYWIMGKVETHYLWIFLGVGLLYGAGLTLMCFKVREGEYPPPPLPIEREGAGGTVGAIRTYLKDSFSHPYYLCYFAASILALLSGAPFNLYAVFYAKSLGMGLDWYFKCIALTYGISLVLSYPLGMLADRFHPLRASLVVLALYGLVMACGIFYVRNAASFAIVMIAHGVLAGTYGTTAASLGQRLLPRAKFAEISSACGLIGSIAFMLLPPVLGFVLDHTHHAYRYVFHAGLGLAVLGVLAGLLLYRRFLALGGPANYCAPE